MVAAAGNVEHERVVELVSQALERRGEVADSAANVRPPLVQAPPPGLRFQRKDTEQYHVCLAAPGIARTDRRRFAASLLDAILGGSASSRLFQEIREKRGLAYSVYSFASQYTDTGQIGIYVGTREDNLAEALAIAAEQIADVAAGNVPDRELNRAKENLKGRILLSMESTSARMNRLGKSLITDSELLSLERLVAEIDAVEASSVAELAAALLAPEQLSAAGIGPDEERFMAALAHGDAGARASARVKVLLNGRGGKVGAVLAPALEAAGHALVASLADADAMVDFTRPDAVVANVLAAIDGRRARDRRHERLGSGGGRRGRAHRRRAGVLRAELRDRGRPDDAVRRAGAPAAAGRGDHRAAPRHEGRRAVGHGQGDGRAARRRRCRSIRCACRASSRTRRCCSAGRARC